MKIIGLTGGIASGKNFVAEIFQKMGAVVFDADAEIHNLLAYNQTIILQVKNLFPEVIVDRKVDRKILGKIVFSDDEKLKALELILHPPLRDIYDKFLRDAKNSGKEFVVLNIPLLLETKAYKCDYIIAIIPSEAVQFSRFVDREKEKHPQMTAEELAKKFKSVTGKQLTSDERKKHANFIITNNGTRAETLQEIQSVIDAIARQ